MSNWYDDAVEEFGVDYFERGEATGQSLYSNYRWLPEMTIPMVASILEKYPEVREGDSVLDFGCAKGYVVRALRLLRRQGWGMDISSWALDRGKSEGAQGLSTCYDYVHENPAALPDHFELTVAKDVLEHVSPEHIGQVLTFLRNISRQLFVVVPVAEENISKRKYVIPSMHLDRTHRICWTHNEWLSALRAAGFNNNTYHFQWPGMKQAYEAYPRGHVFIQCQT